ncbi:MAG: substrate-binding domain-containing protein, partial [Pseudomonadota bacterium]
AAGRVPCSRATGKLLFPAREVHAWLAGNSHGKAISKPNVFLGSHDPLLEWALRQSECGLATFFDGSLDGLDRMQAGEGIAAGIHIYDAAQDIWNTPAVTDRFSVENAVLVHFAKRARGLVLGKGLTGKIQKLADLRGHRFVPRQPQSGSTVLLRDLLKRANLDDTALTFTEPARSEQDAVLRVAAGEADATLGLGALAQQFGLDFLPLISEDFDLLMDRKAYFDPPLQTFLAFLQSRSFRKHAGDGAGDSYDVARCGTIVWNG